MRTVFVYHTDGVTICCGEEPLIKGIPALLFVYMLRAFCMTGKTVFFLAELRKAEKAFGSGNNLEARLGRLAKRLEERVPGVKLRKRRGFRVLEGQGPIELVER